jgi:hypothetical protein
MTDVRIDAKVSGAIARILRMDAADVPILRAFHGVLADILLTASDADETGADARIREDIHAALDANGGLLEALVNIGVRDGRVDLRGAITNAHDRERLAGIARATSGVREVHDHMVWIDHAARAFLLSPEDSCPD